MKLRGRDVPKPRLQEEEAPLLARDSCPSASQPHLLVLPVRLLRNVLGFLQLDLLQLHFLLILQSSVFDDFHASAQKKSKHSEG